MYTFTGGQEGGQDIFSGGAIAPFWLRNCTRITAGPYLNLHFELVESGLQLFSMFVQSEAIHQKWTLGTFRLLPRNFPSVVLHRGRSQVFFTAGPRF